MKKNEYEYDIMISYCHADKELVHRVQHFLADHGFKIWIDHDQMYGPGKTMSPFFVLILL